MRKSMITTGLVAIFPVSGLALAPPAMAEERTCRGTIGAVTIDNVRVLQGATCRLSGTIVQAPSRSSATPGSLPWTSQLSAKFRQKTTTASRFGAAESAEASNSTRVSRPCCGTTVSGRTCSRSATLAHRSPPSTASTATCIASRTTRVPWVGRTPWGAANRTGAPTCDAPAAAPAQPPAAVTDRACTSMGHIARDGESWMRPFR